MSIVLETKKGDAGVKVRLNTAARTAKESSPLEKLFAELSHIQKKHKDSRTAEAIAWIKEPLTINEQGMYFRTFDKTDMQTRSGKKISVEHSVKSVKRPWKPLKALARKQKNSGPLPDSCRLARVQLRFMILSGASRADLLRKAQQTETCHCYEKSGETGKVRKVVVRAGYHDMIQYDKMGPVRYRPSQDVPDAFDMIPVPIAARDEKEIAVIVAKHKSQLRAKRALK